jgi:pimeloyl-ACP methyl ester carboxylesterase
MFETVKRLKYGARVLLARNGGHPQSLSIAGRSTVIMTAGEGVPFVYLHSVLGESSMWLPFYAAWSKRFRVLVPTHPGYGKSEGFEEIDTIEDLAFHYIWLFDELGLDQVVLGGVSLGAWIAAEIAVRWPERINRLWLSGAPGLWVAEEPLSDIFRYSRDIRKLRELLFFDPDSYIAKMVLVDEPGEERMLQSYQAMTVLARLTWDRPYDPKLASRLHRVRCPVLLLWGAEDRLVPTAYAEAYRRQLPQAEMKFIPRCGHLPMFEREAEFVQQVTRFAEA